MELTVGGLRAWLEGKDDGLRVFLDCGHDGDVVRAPRLWVEEPVEKVRERVLIDGAAEAAVRRTDGGLIVPG